MVVRYLQYFAPERGAKHCDEYVCMFACRYHTAKLLQISVHVSRGRGLVLLWWRGDTLRASGFVNDVTFSHNGPYGVSCIRNSTATETYSIDSKQILLND